MSHPLLYEINARCWVGELSRARARPVTLREAVEGKAAEWRRLGFTHIWLMGVWSNGLQARQQALTDPNLRRVYQEVLPDWSEADVGGSPYAIAEYQVPATLGGEEGLEECRQVLHRHGLKLVLDFVPNHLGLDHAWLRERPELFVQAKPGSAEAFRVETRQGELWLAHGKDPYFPAWTDTAQLDYRRSETRQAMQDLLLSLTERCDGVRCDMAMLVLNEVFASTWKHSPHSGEAASGEFWAEAISAVRRSRPDFLFLAEAYWGLEGKLIDQGFDYVYDKALYDRLVDRDAYGAQQHLLEMPPKRLAQGAHFLENHDEPRIASRLSLAEGRAAALVILGLPGMRFLHEGQLWGSRIRIPVQLLRRPAEPKQEEVARFYARVLELLDQTSVGRGRGELLVPAAAWEGNPTGKNFIVVQWQKEETGLDIIAVNLAPHQSQCRVWPKIGDSKTGKLAMQDLLGGGQRLVEAAELKQQGLYLDLTAGTGQFWHFEPA